MDTLNLLSSSSSSSSRLQRSRTPDPIKSRAGDAGKSRAKDLDRPRSKENENYKGKLKKDTKDIYKHAFDSARKAEEHKFKAKFDLLLSDLRRTLDKKSPHGLSDNFASTSYGEVMLSFRGRVKDLLVGFSQRLQLAYESFESSESPDERVQQVKQNVSRFLEDILGESLDLTSDEAVSDLSSLSDDSASDRHSFEDQIAQAVVSKILENHRREVSNSLGRDRRRHLSTPSLVPGDEDEDDYVDGQSPAASDYEAESSDLAKDFEDLKNFVRETQSWTKPASNDYTKNEDLDSSGRPRTSSLDSGYNSKDREPPLPEFSDFAYLDFNSAELDPDLLQMNLAVIPEETEEELEQDASDVSDTHWRENWIFKGSAPSAFDHLGRKNIRGDGDDTPQYLAVPKPEDYLTPKIGNKDIDQLSDLSDNEDFTDDDNSFYPGTSEELARISRHKRPSSTTRLDNDLDQESLVLSQQKRKSVDSYDAVDLDFEDECVGTEDFVGPIVQPSKQELKLLEDLVPADDDDPKFVVPPESVTVQEGDPVKFTCRVSGTQPIDVFWYREHEEVEELEESEDIELVQEGDKHTAVLYNVPKSHAGQYMAIALGDKGKAIKYLTVTVKDNKQELKKPEFLKELKDLEVIEGQSVKFRCKVKGYPQPRINWYKDGVLLKGSKSCRIEKFGNRDYILTIDWATMDDDAEYMVVAKNVAGEVKSTAQVIVEPYNETHPLHSKPRTYSVTSTITTDSDSDRPSSAMQMNRDEPKLDSLAQKVAATRDHMRLEAEDMLVTAEEGDSAKKVRMLTSNALSVLRTAEEIIQSEREMDYSPRSSEHTNISSVSGQEEENNNKNVSSTFDSSSPARNGTQGNSDSFVSGNSSVTDLHLPPLTDDFSLDLPPLEDDYLSHDSSSYREEVSISLSSKPKVNSAQKHQQEPQSQPPKGAGTSGYFDSVTNGASRFNSTNSASTARGDEYGSNANSASLSSTSLSSTSANTVKTSFSDKLSPSGRLSSSTAGLLDGKSLDSETPSKDDLMTRSDVTVDSQDSGLVLNFGSKEVDREVYSRDYDVVPRTPEDTGERKRWSVTLDPYSPVAEVVNRQPSVDETEEKIYLTAGKMYHLEDRVKELESRVQGGGVGRPPVHSLADLEDQVAKTAAQVERSEKEVTGIEKALTSLQFSPRSSRGSNSSTSSTPRESIDSGVSSFTPERIERPQPVHMVGQTQEDDVPESRAEYDADSGIELPSVSRLRAMFGKRKEDEEGGNFKRIHSITARSVPKEQLEKLRESWHNPTSDGIRVKNNPVQSRTTVQLQQVKPESQMPGHTTASTVKVLLSQGDTQKDSRVPAPQRQIRRVNLPEPAQYRQLDPANEPVLIYPENDTQASTAALGVSQASAVARPRTPVPPTVQTSTSATRAASAGVQAGASRVRPQSAHSNADATDGQEPKPPTARIRSGCISARAAFWERRIMQGEATDLNVEEEFPEMVQESSA